MEKDNIIELIRPGEFRDHLTEILREGAQALVLQAVETEFAAFREPFSRKATRWSQTRCQTWPFARAEGGDGYWDHPR